MSDREIEEEKDAELRALATVWGNNHGLNYACLPVKGIVRLVLEKCPTWKEWCKGDDPRGAGNKIGRRITKLGIPQMDEKGRMLY